MKYCVLIIDGASGWPLEERENRTCLELADTPHLDAMTQKGMLGLTRTVPPGMEPSSALACMSLLGYDPGVYYRGRAAIEARSMGVPVAEGEVAFRCNLVAVSDGRMESYCAGHISTEEGRQLVEALNEKLGNDDIRFYPGIGYRHLLKLKNRPETMGAECTPPHDISGRPVAQYLPQGPGGAILRELMRASEAVLKEHPVNMARRRRGETAATTIWLFWGSRRLPDIPSLRRRYALKAALTSGVDLLKGLGQMMGMDILDIEGVTDGPDNNYFAQGQRALKALSNHDLVVIHVEAPDEAAHNGDIDGKIEAIQRVDREIVSQIASYKRRSLRALVMPDHPTPIETGSHTSEPVPFLLWGPGIAGNGATRFTEAEAENTGFFIEEGYNIISWLVGKIVEA